MKIKLVVIGLVCFGCAALLHAQESDNESEDLRSQVKKLSEIGEGFAAASAMSSSTDSASLRQIASDYREFSGNFGSMQSYLESGNYNEASTVLHRWLARTKNKAVKQALTELLAAVQVEEKKRAAELAGLTDELLKNVAASLKKVKTPEEVDDLQQDVRDFRNSQFNSNNREIQKLANRLGQADSFLSNWRQFLAYRDAADWDSALSMLRNMRRESQTGGVMSTKDIAEQFADVLRKCLAQPMKDDEKSDTGAMLAKAVTDIMEGVKSPADAPEAVRKLNIIQNVAGGFQGSSINNLRNGLENVIRLQQLYDRGAYGQILSPNWPAMGYRDTPYDQRIEDMGTAIQTRAVAALTGYKDLGEMTPGEGTAAFLKTAAEKAYKDKDWTRLFTLLTYYSTVSGDRYIRGGLSSEGVRAFLAGQQLEQAGQFRDAVRQYTLCIAEIGPLVPRDEAAVAIKRLRAAHPDAFQPEVEIK